MNAPKRPSIRAVEENDTTLIVEGLVVPFDGPFPGGPRGTDSYRTWFSADTKFCLDWYPAGVPALWDHGFETDRVIQGQTVRGHALTPIGTGDIASVRIDEAGLWAQTQIDKQARYYDEMAKMLDLENQGKASRLYHSSESVEHHVKIDARTGHVDQWPLISWSLTPTPSNLYATVTAAQVRSACRAAGLDLLGESEWIKDESSIVTEPTARRFFITSRQAAEPTDLPAEDEPAARATSLNTDNIDTPLNVEKSAEDIRSDIQDVLNGPNMAMMPMQFRYWVRNLFITAIPLAGYAIVECYECGDDYSGESTYWKYPWALGDDLEPVLDAPTEVEQTWVESAAMRAEIPLTLNAEWLSRHASAFALRTKDLSESRAAENRTLSEPNRAGIAEAGAGFRQLADECDDLLAQDRQTAVKAAKAARDADPAVRKQRLRLLELYDTDILTA